MGKQLDRREFLALTGAGMAGWALSGAHGQEHAGAGQNGAMYTFAAVADPHLSENREGELTGAEKFRRVLGAIETLDPAPEFMLMLGDIHPTVLEVLLPEASLPIHAVAGNHESKEGRELLRSLFPDDFQGKDYYAFTHRDDLYIAMCNAAHVDHVGHFETETNTPSVGQCEWIEEQLARRDKFNRVILFGHIPPDPELRPNGMCLGQNDGRWLAQKVQDTQPTALFFGHRHHRVWFDIAGVPVYGMRSCNWNFNNEPVGFGHVFAGSNGLDVRFIETGEEA